MTCVICKKEIEPGSPYAPFCSDRCRLIDLGNWAAERYSISTPIDPQAEADDDSGDSQRGR
jgi:endogenous inhibitor of DNA gyrase (YacG/DUF329 family)